MRLPALLRLLAAVSTIPSFAQDPQRVLQTSVAFNSQRNAATNLAPEIKTQVDQAAAGAQQAFREAKLGDALRHLYRGIALLNGLAWTPERELWTGLDLKVTNGIWEPGQAQEIRLEPVYTTAGEAKLNLTARLEPAPKGAALDPFPLGDHPLASKPWSQRITPPASANGPYRLVLTATLDGQPLAPPKTVSIRVAKGLDKEAEALVKRLANLPPDAGRKHPAAHATAAYQLELYRLVKEGKLNPASADPAAGFAAANSMLDSLESGKDPLAGRKGDSHRAYRSPVDSSLQPYRLYVPDSYDGKKPTPLVVALHGMGGDENTLFDRYGAGAFVKEAARLGFLMVAPKGRGPAAMYQGDAEKDVLDVLAEVRRDFQVDASRIYVMGHSMGGFGSWSIAMNHPEIWAALGPIAGGGNPARMETIKHIPQYVVHGDRDNTVKVDSSRRMVEAARKAGTTVEYLEVAGGGHNDVVVPALPALFDWLLKQQKKAAASN